MNKKAVQSKGMKNESEKQVTQRDKENKQTNADANSPPQTEKAEMTGLDKHVKSKTIKEKGFAMSLILPSV